MTEKIPETVETHFKYRLHQKMLSVVDRIKDLITDTYDKELSDVVSDQNSKTHPKLYIKDFTDRLDDFDYLNISNNEISIRTPDEDNFNFSGKLRIIEVIMNGLSGTYVEMDDNEFMLVFGKAPVTADIVEDSSDSSRIYLVKYDDVVKSREEALGKKFTVFPFSNTPPINIFEAGDKLLNDNINKWIEESIEEAKSDIIDNVQGSNVNEL